MANFTFTFIKNLQAVQILILANLCFEHQQDLNHNNPSLTADNRKNLQKSLSISMTTKKRMHILQNSQFEKYALMCGNPLCIDALESCIRKKVKI
jgi:hypothetical protein